MASIPQRVSESVRRLNPKLYGQTYISTSAELPDTEQCERPQELARSDAGEAQSTECLRVLFTLRRVRLLDVDAKYSSVKDLLDCLAFSGVIRGDKEGQISLDVRQEKVGSFKDERTIIEVYEPTGSCSVRLLLKYLDY